MVTLTPDMQIEQLISFFQKWVNNTLPLAFQYFFFTCLVFFIFFVWKKKNVWYANIQQKYPANKHVKREIFYSFTSLLILGLVLTATVWLTKNGYTLAYKHISDRGWGYYFFSLVVMVFIHDTYFYWGHRAMHWGPLFKYVHKTHHISTNPTPFAAYAFHPLEAVFEMSIVFVLIFTIPHHASAITAFGVYSIMVNVGGHLGHEFFPKSFARHKIWKWHNTSTHHNLHHTHVKTNFGLYFNFWDTMMKTNSKNYVEHFEMLADRREAAKAAKKMAEQAQGESVILSTEPVSA